MLDVISPPAAADKSSRLSGSGCEASPKTTPVRLNVPSPPRSAVGAMDSGGDAEACSPPMSWDANAETRPVFEWDDLAAVQAEVSRASAALADARWRLEGAEGSLYWQYRLLDCALNDAEALRKACFVDEETELRSATCSCDGCAAARNLEGMQRAREQMLQCSPKSRVGLAGRVLWGDPHSA
eukprot:4383391-Prymnesium_polylepis.1